MKKTWSTVIAATILFSSSAAVAAPSTADKCKASKSKAVGGYYACRQKAEATAIKKAGIPDYTKCVAKFGDKWDDAEIAGANECPDNIALTSDVATFVEEQATAASAIIAGGAISNPVCGDGVINAPGEHCDGAALDGFTCGTFGLHGSLACTGACDFNLGGCTACPAPGIEYGGACWVLGALAADCDAACDVLGLVYEDTTAIIPGSEGSDANCVALLDVLGAPGGALDNAGGDCVDLGIGCSVIPNAGFRARCGTPATDSSSSFADARRVCACE